MSCSSVVISRADTPSMDPFFDDRPRRKHEEPTGRNRAANSVPPSPWRQGAPGRRPQYGGLGPAGRPPEAVHFVGRGVWAKLNGVSHTAGGRPRDGPAPLPDTPLPSTRGMAPAASVERHVTTAFGTGVHLHGHGTGEGGSDELGAPTVGQRQRGAWQMPGTCCCRARTRSRIMRLQSKGLSLRILQGGIRAAARRCPTCAWPPGGRCGLRPCVWSPDGLQALLRHVL